MPHILITPIALGKRRPVRQMPDWRRPGSGRNVLLEVLDLPKIPDIDAELIGRGHYPAPRSLRVAIVGYHLVEASHRVPHVRRVVDRQFPILRASKLG